MSCEPTPLPREPQNAPPLPPAPGDTQLVTDSDAPMVRTDREETDAVGAMRRGLKEYLSQVSKDVAGAKVHFEDVLEEWAEPEDQAVAYPAAAVLIPDGLVTFDQTSFAPSILADDRLPSGRYVIKLSEATTTLVIETYCSTPGERLGVSMLLEEALNPVDWMYGFHLDLPHYFGQRASFAVEQVELPDDATSARHGLRVVRAKVMGRISVVRPRKLPTMQPKLDIRVTDVITAGTFPLAGNSR